MNSTSGNQSVLRKTANSRLTQIAVLLLVAVAAGIFCYVQNRYTAATLVLQIKTFARGERFVEIIDGRGDKTVRQFILGDDTGAASYYPVELPRIFPAKIWIAPLGDSGSFEVDRISLQLDSVHYGWSPEGCSQLTLTSGRMLREQCKDDAPVLTVNGDRSFTLTGIPEMRTMQSPTVRTGMALCLVVSVMIAGLWLLHPLKNAVQKTMLEECGIRLIWLVLIAIYLLQLSAVWRYSVDLPFWEEWDYFLPQALPRGLTWEWLFSFENYHRVLPTKLMAWLNYRLFGLDFTLQKLVNYLIFGCLLIQVAKLKQAVVGKGEFWAFPAFLLFMLSPIAFENHANSYQSQIHLVLVLAIVALLAAYSAKQTLTSMILFSLSMLLAINTSSSGMTAALVIICCWSGYILLSIAAGKESLQQLGRLLPVPVLIIIPGLVTWFIGFRSSSEAGVAWANPATALFWQTFLSLVGMGFGFDGGRVFPGIVLLLIISCPIIILMADSEKRTQKPVWLVTTGILCILAILAAISITRGIYAGTGNSSRYCEFGFLLIPLTALVWWFALKPGRQRHIALGLFWGVCFLAYLDNWSYSPYRDMRQMNYFVIETLEENLAGKSDGLFPWTHSKPLEPYFNSARKLDVKFTRQFSGMPDSRPKGAP